MSWLVQLAALVAALAVALTVLPEWFDAGSPRPPSPSTTTTMPVNFTQPEHAKGVVVADFARHDLPPVLHGGRVTHLLSGMHFDNILQDTPDELRPPSVIYFTGFESCAAAQAAQERAFTKLAETKLPSRERLLVAMYDMDANPVRAWFKFTPEMDLAKRFGVTECGQVVFVPRGSECDGFTEYCTQPAASSASDPLLTKVGCSDFVDKCAPLVKRYNFSSSSSSDATRLLAEWILKLTAAEGEPHISPVFGSYAEQNKWLLKRDETTTDTEFRNYFLVESFPAFTPLGFSAMPVPQEVQQWLMEFWHKNKLTARVREPWNAASTQMNFHEEPTTFVSLDPERDMLHKLANDIIKPLVEEWSGMEALELTSFYGIREYKAGGGGDEFSAAGSFLKSHIDRIDTHVLSVTITLAKTNASDINQVLTPEQESAMPAWPLQVMGFDGQLYRHTHPAGTMILYESSKLAHGRPYHNPHGGMDHVGCFCHFRPINKDKGSAEKWDAITNNAREHKARNVKQEEAYVSKPVQEPTVPVFSKHRFGDGTITASPKTLLVTFHNKHNEPVDLHWVGGGDGDRLVLQGTLQPGASMQRTTYAGHRFVWTARAGTEALPRGKFEIELGSMAYGYGGGGGK